MNFIENETVAKAVLVGIVTDRDSLEETEKSIKELERLLDTAGGETFAVVIQNKSTPDPRTLIGSGKAAEISGLCKDNDIKLIIFDEELTPAQIRNLEDEIGNDVMVIDRSMLILDIFALHAVSGEGKLQVELAQLKYTAPRLTGKGNDMSRLGGGIGTRGPGESKLESDRRHLKRRVSALEEEIKILEKNRRNMRASRDRSGLCKVAVVGYTNAGKSTLLNTLTGAGILAQDKLFATLDPTTRKYTLPQGEQILLTDTVGFIRKLPHHLVSAFKSTLEEAAYADIIIIVIDASDPESEEQLECTERTLEELGASDKPVIYAYNKCDKGIYDSLAVGNPAQRENTVYISALTGQGCDGLAQIIERIIHESKKTVSFLFPNSQHGLINLLYENAVVKDVDYTENGVSVKAVVDKRIWGKLKKYDVDCTDFNENCNSEDL